MKFLNTVLLSLIASVLFACGDGFSTTTSTDIALDPELIVDSEGNEYANLVFPQPLSVGRFEQKVLKILNSGQQDLLIRGIAIDGQPDCDRVKRNVAPAQPLGMSDDGTDLDSNCSFSIEQAPSFATPDAPITIAPGGERQVVLAYKALSLTAAEPRNLVLQTNVQGKETVNVRLSVRSGDAQLSVSQDAVAFPAGTESTKSLLFRNSGTSQLTITSLRIVPLTAPPTDASGNEVSEFSVLEGELPDPFQIPAGGSAEVRLRYAPLDDIADEAQLVITSNSAQGATKEVFLTSGTLTSELVVQPNPLIFGESAPSEPATQEFSVSNAGLKLLSIQGMTITPENQGFSLLDNTGSVIDISDANNPRPIIDLAGGAARTFTIQYEPTGGNDTDGVLTIRTNADNFAAVGGLVSIPLTLSGANIADLEIDRLSIDFSSVGAGENNTEAIVLTNPGGQPLDITRISLSNDMDADVVPSDSAFEIVSGGGPMTLAGGAMHTVEVRFSRAADDRNARVGALIIDSSASNGRDVVYFRSNPPL